MYLFYCLYISIYDCSTKKKIKFQISFSSVYIINVPTSIDNLLQSRCLYIFISIYLYIYIYIMYDIFMHKGCTRAACFNIAMIISLFLSLYTSMY